MLTLSLLCYPPTPAPFLPLLVRIFKGRVHVSPFSGHVNHPSFPSISAMSSCCHCPGWSLLRVKQEGYNSIRPSLVCANNCPRRTMTNVDSCSRSSLQGNIEQVKHLDTQFQSSQGIETHHMYDCRNEDSNN
jgi:hypothetical protein